MAQKEGTVGAMRDDEIRRILTEANPWWRAAARGADPRAWTRDHRLLRDRARFDLGHRSSALRDLADGPISDSLIVLTGPRRVGKSVALLDLAADLCGRADVDARQIVHLPCDALTARDLRRALTLGRELTRVGEGVEPARVWLLDEVSAVKGWTAIVKAARDSSHGRFGDDTVVVTGSRWVQGEDVEGNLLAGRAGTGGHRRVRHLFPMTFREFVAATRSNLLLPDTVHPADLQNAEVREVLRSLAFDVDEYDLAWQDYLTCGGFPRAVAEHIRRGVISDGYIHDMAAWLHRDVDPDGPPQSLPLLLDHVVTRMTSPLSIRETAEHLSAGRVATGTRLNRMVASFAGLWCPQHDQGRVVANAQMKIYVTDPLLAHMPSRLRSGLVTPAMPALTEAALAVALARRIDELEEGRWVGGDTIGYVRTGSGNEVDLGPADVPTAAGGSVTVPIEAKWVDSGWRSAAQVVERKYGGGVLATKSLLDLDHPTWAVPAPLVALLLL